MKETDENHLLTSYDIVGYLESCGIDAERRSIYKDIEAISWIILQENIGLDEVDMFKGGEIHPFVFYSTIFDCLSSSPRIKTLLAHFWGQTPPPKGFQ